MQAQNAPEVPAAQNGNHGALISQLALRRVAIDTWRENVAYLHRD